MASANEVKVSYVADIKDLTAKLQSISGITASEARKQVNAVVAGQKAQASAMAKAAGSTDAAGLAASKAAKAFGPLGGIFARLDPTAGALSSTVAAGTSVLEGFGVTAAASGVAVGALAVALGAGYAAYKALNAEEDRAVAVSALVSAAHQQMAPLIDATRIAEIKAAVATGQMTEEAGRLALEGVAAMKAFGAATADTTAKVRALHDEQSSTGQQVKDTAVEWTKAAAELYGGWNPIANAAAYYTRNLVDTSGDLQVQVDALMGTQGEANAITKAGVKATDDAAAADLRKAAATKARAKAEADAANSAAGFQNAANLLNKDREEERKGEKAYSDMVIQGAAEQAAASKALADQQIADAKRVADEQERARVTRLSDEIAVMGAVANLGNQLVSATGKQYDTTTAAGRRAAIKQFRTQKAADLAIGAINTAVAVSSALKEYPVPPMSIIMGGLALGSGLVAEAAIAASPPPSFHSGYAPDEMQARVLKSEPVVSPVGASILGRKNIADANAGKTPTAGGYQGPAPVIIDHRVMESLVKREIANGGALASALRSSSGGAYGHRKNRRSVTG